MRIEEWRIAYFVFFGLLLLAAAIAISQGLTEDAIRTFLRGTARTSLALFLLAFSASSLQAIFRSRWSAWLLRNRRYLGVSFALSHGIHLVAIMLLAAMFPHPFLDRLGSVSLIAGAIAYLFILVMCVTSFSGPKRTLNPKHWKLLHTFGSYYIWFIFAQSYIPKALKDPFYIPFAVALLGALAFRLGRSFVNRGLVIRKSPETT